MRTIRVFVSGTFADFQAEREVLQRRVFPELRSRCAALGLHLLDVDLRWGVPASTSPAKICELCIESVRCADVCVVLLGARYGWQPDAQARPSGSAALIAAEVGAVSLEGQAPLPEPQAPLQPLLLLLPPGGCCWSCVPCMRPSLEYVPL